MMSTKESPTVEGAESEPAQGSIETEIRYRDRPSDDGKYGNEADDPRPDESRRKSAEATEKR